MVSAAGLAALAAWSFRPVFDVDAGLALALAVVVPPVVVAVWELLTSSVLKRLSGGVSTALALLWVVAAVAAVTRPGGDALSGPFRLLTSVLPTEAAAPQLAAVSVLAGLTSLAAVHLTAKGPLLPVLPPLVCLVLGLSLGAAAGPLPAWYVPGFVVVSTVPVLLSAGTASRARLVVGGVVVALAAAAGLAFGLLGPAPRPPASVQALVDAPVQPKRHTNPMAQYLALRDGSVVLEIDGTASQRVDRLGMVTMTAFDGRAWSPEADYRRAAHQLPVAPQSTAPRREVTLDLRVGTPGSLGWLPRPGWPSRVSVPNLGFDADTGDLVVPAGQEPPAQYRISASEPVVSPDLLRTDQPAGVQRPDLVLPPEVLGFVNVATAGHDTELDRFLGLYHNLRAEPFHYDVSDEAAGGNGLYQISALLKNHRGTSEQYASAFAVMCRQLGWDARVVLGFKPRWDGDELRVQGQDVFAWTEVRFERLGWLPIDPSPTRTAALGDDAPDEATGTVPGLVELPPAYEPDPAPEPETGGVAPPDPVATPASGRSSSVVLLVVGVGLLALLFAIPLLKAARRRARRRASPRRRVAEAWRDAVAALRAGGAHVHGGQTTGQVLQAAPESCAPALRLLAELVDRVAFSPDEVIQDMATTAELHGDQVRSRIRAGLGAGRRVAWLFDLRPLLAERRPVEYADLRPGLRSN
ncbi:hypothetical protein ALI22I_14555 [Saccharothrix sp. ALI-22-I]|nr:hypothetical protein ALI22I_14555 [Saccharothrix sp. ALI-22-I]